MIVGAVVGPIVGVVLKEKKRNTLYAEWIARIWEAAMKDAEVAANSTASAATSCVDGDGIYSS